MSDTQILEKTTADKTNFLNSAFLESLKNYKLSFFYHDLAAGFVVSLIALPLAMALAIAVGLPPEHGIYTAIVAGIIAAAFGGSKMQVSGPTAAFVVIVAPIVTEFGLHGLIWCEIIAGFILIFMSVFRLGRYINFVPYPVTTGFTAGIGLVIATLALNDFFGLHIAKLDGSYFHKVTLIFSNMNNFNLFEFIVGLSCLLCIIFTRKISKPVPSQVIGIAAASLIAYIFSQNNIDISTIGNHFHYESMGKILNGIPAAAPHLYLPNLNHSDLLEIPSFDELQKILPSSLVVAILAALESLLSATVADNISQDKNEQHNSNAELFGIGLANIGSGLFAGIPATGAIARTSININSGAKTPFAAIFHAIFILLYVLLFAGLINYVPMAALAALLIHTAYKMAHIDKIIENFRYASKSDILVLLTCFILTAFIDMVFGVTFGILLAALLFIKHITSLTSVSSMNYDSELSTSIQDKTVTYKIDGAIFFATTEKLSINYNFIHDNINEVVIDMRGTYFIDLSGSKALEKMLNQIAKEHRKIIIYLRDELADKLSLHLSEFLDNNKQCKLIMKG